ncbi:hypothetical protein ABZ569_33285 [Streptomyces albus]|uniref:DUF6197 family protein n=1 Tax=Streptomyces albus TaxID=1888 RepID=UPI0033E6C8AF
MNKISPVFREAARLIESNGLAKEAMYSSDDLPVMQRPMCTVGALRAAATGHPLNCRSVTVAEAVYFLARTISPGKDPMLRLMRWSDIPGRTAQDVATALRKAAQDAEAEGR